MAANTPVPTDAEIDALIAQHWPAFATVGSIPLQGLHAAFRDGLARWGAQPAPAASLVPLTDEQIEAAVPEYYVEDVLDFKGGVRFAERHHGITKGA